jgi:hypothetical protein
MAARSAMVGSVGVIVFEGSEWFGQKQCCILAF